MLEDIEEDRLSIIRSQEPSRLAQKISPRGKINGNKSFSNNGTRPLPGVPPSDSVSVRSSSQQSMRPLPPLPRTGAFETVAKGQSLNELEMQKLLESSGVKEVEKVDSTGCFTCCKGQKNQVSLG